MKFRQYTKGFYGFTQGGYYKGKGSYKDYVWKILCKPSGDSKNIIFTIEVIKTVNSMDLPVGTITRCGLPFISRVRVEI